MRVDECTFIRLINSLVAQGVLRMTSQRSVEKSQDRFGAGLSRKRCFSGECRFIRLESPPCPALFPRDCARLVKLEKWALRSHPCGLFSRLSLFLHHLNVPHEETASHHTKTSKLRSRLFARPEAGHSRCCLSLIPASFIAAAVSLLSLLHSRRRKTCKRVNSVRCGSFLRNLLNLLVYPSNEATLLLDSLLCNHEPPRRGIPLLKDGQSAWKCAPRCGRSRCCLRGCFGKICR